MKTENKNFLKSMIPNQNFLIVVMLIISLLHLFGIIYTSRNCKNKYGDKVSCIYFKEPTKPCTDYDCVVFSYTGILLSLYLLILQIPSVSKLVKTIVSKHKYLSLLVISPFFIALGLNIEMLVRYYKKKKEDKNKENFDTENNNSSEFVDILWFIGKIIMMIIIILLLIAMCSNAPLFCYIFNIIGDILNIIFN